MNTCTVRVRTVLYEHLYSEDEDSSVLTLVQSGGGQLFMNIYTVRMRIFLYKHMFSQVEDRFL